MDQGGVYPFDAMGLRPPGCYAPGALVTMPCGSAPYGLYAGGYMVLPIELDLPPNEPVGWQFRFPGGNSTDGSLAMLLTTLFGTGDAVDQIVIEQRTMQLGARAFLAPTSNAVTPFVHLFGALVPARGTWAPNYLPTPLVIIPGTTIQMGFVNTDDVDHDIRAMLEGQTLYRGIACVECNGDGHYKKYGGQKRHAERLLNAGGFGAQGACPQCAGLGCLPGLPGLPQGGLSADWPAFISRTTQVLEAANTAGDTQAIEIPAESGAYGYALEDVIGTSRRVSDNSLQTANLRVNDIRTIQTRTHQWGDVNQGQDQKPLLRADLWLGLEPDGQRHRLPTSLIVRPSERGVVVFQNLDTEQVVVQVSFYGRRLVPKIAQAVRADMRQHIVG